MARSTPMQEPIATWEKLWSYNTTRMKGTGINNTNHAEMNTVNSVCVSKSQSAHGTHKYNRKHVNAFSLEEVSGRIGIVCVFRPKAKGRTR
mmetsp:Transcript_41975/g.116847  ORF Transcript_41975/g.116847 Transcript_41975/m.116847 type:complete len:91 (-) Transcript_41975:20-292(-)